MFNIDNTIQATASGNRILAANKIHDVKLANVEATTIGQGATYEVLSLTFEGVKDSAGTFTYTVFPPFGDNPTARTTGTYGENPSPAEELVVRMKQLISVFNKKAFDEIEGGKRLNIDTWEKLRLMMVKLLTPGIGQETKLKLVANKNGQSTVPPFIAGIGRDGKPYARNNFVGSEDVVKFSPYELERIEKTANARPTNMSSLLETPAKGSEDDKSLEDFDFESL